MRIYPERETMTLDSFWLAIDKYEIPQANRAFSIELEGYEIRVERVSGINVKRVSQSCGETQQQQRNSPIGMAAAIDHELVQLALREFAGQVKCKHLIDARRAFTGDLLAFHSARGWRYSEY